MSLESLPIKVPAAATMPRAVAKFLDDADERIHEWFVRKPSPQVSGFVPSDYPTVYHTLRAVVALGFDPGMFLEWGCGFGVITGLAQLLGHDAHGIEIDSELVDRARALIDDHDLEAEIHSGSYVPNDYDGSVFDVIDYIPIEAGPQAYDDIGLDIADFDCIFVFPWPGTEQFHFDMFDRHAAPGTILVTHHGVEGTLVRRKRN